VPLPTLRAVSATLCAFALVLTITRAATAEPKNVLLINTFGREFEPFRYFVAALRTELSRQSPEPIDFFEAALATSRFAEDEGEAIFARYLMSLFADRRLDLIIAVGAPAARFVQRNRQQLFPSTPAVLSGVDQRRLNEKDLTNADAAVSFKTDRLSVVENILTVLPQTKEVAIVVGTAPNERFWLEEMQRELEPLAERVKLTWINTNSFSEVLERVTVLPADAAIYFGPFAVDSGALTADDASAVAAIRAVANAPIFGTFDAYLGQGVVGGPMISLGDLAKDAAAVSLRILQGEQPEDIKVPPIAAGPPGFDWRELQRWGISETKLPSGSTIHFREPTIWQRYKKYIVFAAGLLALQTVFIAALLMNGRRLRRANAERTRAEAEAHALTGQLIAVQEEERSRLARELHDDITQRLALLAIDLGRDERDAFNSVTSAAVRSTRDGLVRLSRDVHDLSYRLHPSILEDLGLHAALRSECAHFSETSPIQLEVELEEGPDKIPRDVALCLFRVTQEGLRNIARHAEATRAKVRLKHLDGGLELTVSDDGKGFDPLERRDRTSLGQASMRQRVCLLGGAIDIASRRGGGTTVSVRVPLEEEHRSAGTCSVARRSEGHRRRTA
jgi:signal transduction histidine kinase